MLPRTPRQIQGALRLNNARELERQCRICYGNNGETFTQPDQKMVHLLMVPHPWSAMKKNAVTLGYPKARPVSKLGDKVLFLDNSYYRPPIDCSAFILVQRVPLGPLSVPLTNFCTHSSRLSLISSWLPFLPLTFLSQNYMLFLRQEMLLGLPT